MDGAATAGMAATPQSAMAAVTPGTWAAATTAATAVVTWAGTGEVAAAPPTPAATVLVAAVRPAAAGPVASPASRATVPAMRAGRVQAPHPHLRRLQLPRPAAHRPRPPRRPRQVADLRLSPARTGHRQFSANATEDASSTRGRGHRRGRMIGGESLHPPGCSATRIALAEQPVRRFGPPAGPLVGVEGRSLWRSRSFFGHPAEL